MSRTRLPWVAAVALVLTLEAIAQAPVTPRALAQTSTENSDAEARAMELFEESETHYRAGRFREAIVLLNEAYRLHPAPVLLYNLARAHEGLGEFSEALQAYRLYLAAEPTARDRGAIEKRIVMLETKLREQRARDERRAPHEGGGAVAPVPQPMPQPASKPNPAPWVLLGVGALAVAAGAAVLGVAAARHEAAEDEPEGLRAQELQDVAKRFEAAGGATLAVGSAAVVSGLIWGTVDLTVSPEIGGGRAAAWLLVNGCF